MKCFAHDTALKWKIACALLGVASLVAICLTALARRNTDQIRSRLQQTAGNFDATWQELHTQCRSLLSEEKDDEPVRHVQAKLRQRAIIFYEQFIDRNEDCTAMRWETARAYRHVADLYGETGQLDRAEAAFRRTIEFLAMARNDYPNDSAIGLQMADTFCQLGDSLVDFDRSAEAAESYEHAMDVFYDLISDGNDGPEYRYAYVRAFERWLDLVQDFEWPGPVGERFREVIRLSQQGVDGEPTSVLCRLALAMAHLNYAMLHCRSERFTDAKLEMELAMDAIGERAADSPPNEMLLRAEACLFGFRVCLLRKLNCSKEAELACQRFEETMDELRSETTGRIAFAQSLCALSGIFGSAGDLNRAERLMRESLAVTDDATSLFDSPAEYFGTRDGITKELAAILREQGELDAAKRVLLEAIEFQQRTGSNSDRRLLADHWSELGMTYYRAGAFSSAVEAVQTSLQIRTRENASDLLVLAMAKSRLHETEEAQRCYAKATSLIQDLRLTPITLKCLHAEAGNLLQVDPPSPKCTSQAVVPLRLAPLDAPA